MAEMLWTRSGTLIFMLILIERPEMVCRKFSLRESAGK